jgi:hypothetical protein
MGCRRGVERNDQVREKSHAAGWLWRSVAMPRACCSISHAPARPSRAQPLAAPSGGRRRSPRVERYA